MADIGYIYDTTNQYLIDGSQQVAPDGTLQRFDLAPVKISGTNAGALTAGNMQTAAATPIGQAMGATAQQRKMTPFSMTPPVFPEQKIGLNEAMIRMGGATLGAADRGNMAAMSAQAQQYGAIQDYNRAAELARFSNEQEQYNAGLMAYQKAQKNANGTKDPTSMLGSIVVNDAINRAMPMIDGFSTGVIGTLISQIPGTDGKNLTRLLDSVKANAGFDKLQNMRDNSPTGGALGQVSERELNFLQSVFGSLNQDQSAGQLKYNLQLFQFVYNTLIHGFGGHGYAPPPGSEALIQELRGIIGNRQMTGGASQAIEVDAQTQSDIDTYANM